MSTTCTTSRIHGQPASQESFGIAGSGAEHSLSARVPLGPALRRTTILPPEEDIEAVAKDLSDFHAAFMKQYAA